MIREEFIGKLRSIYVGEENAINEIISEYDSMINLNKQLVEECQRLDDEETRLNNIINEYENKGYDIGQERADFLLEIQRLNNIINELEKWLIEHIDEYREMEQDAMFEFRLVLDKLKALKEE